MGSFGGTLLIVSDRTKKVEEGFVCFWASNAEIPKNLSPASYPNLLGIAWHIRSLRDDVFLVRFHGLTARLHNITKQESGALL